MVWTLLEYRAHYAEAEALAQEVQTFRNEAGIPAMNELRNAGHHLLKALGVDGGIADQAELDSAVNHARRATYEATEAGIILAVATVKKFQDDYATIEISDLMADYADNCRSCTAALRLIEAGRQPGFDRGRDHADRIDVFRKIRPFAENLVAVRPEANKRVTRARTSTRRFILGLAVSTVLAIAAIATAIIIG